MQIIDANVILRYLLNDHDRLSPKAKEIIDQHIVIDELIELQNVRQE